MASEDTLPTLKILLVGSSNVGKSALLMRYCDDQFEPESATATIGIDFKIKRLSVRGKAYRLTLFDTAGQERFRTLSTSYYRGAHGVILAYDVSNRKSFADMAKWFDEVESNTVPEVALFLVGTKLDKAATARAVSAEEGLALAREHGALFCEASAKTRENVRRPFVEIVNRIVQDSTLLARASSSRNMAVGSGTTVSLGGGSGGVGPDQGWGACSC